MRRIGLLAWLGIVPVLAGEIPEKAASYHAALAKRPESTALFERFRDAWLEERSTEDLEKELRVRADAGEASAWATLARAYLVTGKTDQALEAFGKARERSPGAWLDLEVARLRLAAKDFATAEKDALAVPQGDPLRLDAVKLAGLACLRAERIDDALAHWTQAVAAAPGDTGLLEDLTELTRREGRLDLALDYCGKWRDATADAYGKAMATLRRAELLLGSQRFDQAMTELAEVLNVSGDDSWLESETLARAEQAHRQRGDATGWAKWIGAKADAQPVRLNFRRVQALALAKAGKPDEALVVLTEVMKRAPGDLPARWQRISLLEQSMKLAQAYDECVELAAKEKSEAAGLRLAELAFRLEKKDELKRALDGVLTAADPAKRVGLAGLYARYGMPAESERIWREEAGAEQGGQALRQLARHLQTAGREGEAKEVWKQLGARDVSQDRIEAAQMLTVAGEREAARGILIQGREKFSAEPGYETALADLAVADGKPDEARAIYLKLARTAKQPSDLTAAIKGWLGTSAKAEDPLKDLGEETADRCLRAAWLAAAGKPLPAVRDGDALERSVRQSLLREQGRWKEVVAMMEAVPGERGPLALSELAEAKMAARDLPAALAAARAWRERVPDQAGAWLFEAGILEKLGKPQDAIVLLRRSAARFEDNEDVARRLFASLEQAVDPREALEWAWKRHDRSSDESVRSGWLREILGFSKDREKLEDLQARFEDRARRDPASPGPLVALAELAKARGDSQAQLGFLRRAAANAPRDTTVISALALLEEQFGETTRALERHASLARLVPGPDSARNLAQAKIRLGDIEGGMRDMQALAGEKGMDLRALEQSAGDLASRGYVEDAIRMLAALDPAQRTARLEYVRGILLDADGREEEAVDAFIRVMNEPDDPAEAQLQAAYGHPGGYGGRSRLPQYSQILQVDRGGDGRFPGVFQGLQVPQSLVEAQLAVKPLLSRLATQRGGEIWEKAAKVVPELAAATQEQWREALDFAQSREQSEMLNWWEFIRSHPGNPLGQLLLVEYGQLSQGKPDDVEALLKTHPPLPVRMQLRWSTGGWRADDPEFLESIDPSEWQDEQVRAQGMATAMRMSVLACQEGTKPPVTAADCSRVIAVLEKVGFTGVQASLMELLKARLALLEGNTEDFLIRLAAWEESLGKLSPQEMQQAGYGPPQDAFEFWRKKAGDPAAEGLLQKIPSPLLRCQLAMDPKPGQRLARVKRELAALPKDAPVETRRGLVRWSWSLLPREQFITGRRDTAINADLRKELEAAAADATDPRLALEATMQLRQLMQYRRNGRGFSQADNLRFKQLITQLAASPDPSDQAYVAQYTGFFGGQRQRNASVVATRWGTASSFSNGNYSSRNNRSTVSTMIAMEDKGQALREATRSLESTARASAGRPENLRELTASLAKAGLLDDALARISLPADAGLGRRVALITLFDACGKDDRSRAGLAEIAAARPWETCWTVRLALHTADDAEMRRLLNSVAERGDFDRTLGQLLAPQDRENANGVLELLGRLADWAPQAKGRRGWVGTALAMLANGGSSGLRALAEKNAAQLECYRRYLRLALDDRRLAETGFRVMCSIRGIETADAITHAARQVLLSGGYTSDEPILSTTRRQGTFELSALEHLVRVATENGDEAAFPADFRERLTAADPGSADWLAKLLAAKTVKELPDISIDQAGSSAWIGLARHGAAMLRAVSLPGRDAWLAEAIRGNKYQSQSGNLRFVIRASLLEAQKKNALPERVIALLEAAAGPRKEWGKKVPADQALQALMQLHPAAGVIADAAMDANPAILISVLDLFREARIPVVNMERHFIQLGMVLKTQIPQPGKDGLTELLGKQRDALYTFGIWQWQGVGSELVFQWQLPQLLQTSRGTTSELMAAVKADPNAGFVDLLLVSTQSGDPTLRRRTLLKAAPDLVKLPVEIRNAVIDNLSANMTQEDLAGLPAVVSTRMAENFAALRKQRMAQVRDSLESLQSGMPGSSTHSLQYGALLAQVIGEDDAITAEILAAWRPLAEADKSGKKTGEFTNGLIANTRGGMRTTLAVLRLLDSLWKDAPITPQDPRSGDPVGGLLSQLAPENTRDPALWHQIAALSPKLQARFWLAATRHADGFNLTADPKLLASLRQASQGGEVTRTALEWSFQLAGVQRDPKSKMDGAALLGFTNALKAAGAPAEDIAALVCRSYPWLPRMENPGLIMAETPALLDGLKTLPAEQGEQLIRGVQNLWEQIQYERAKVRGEHREVFGGQAPSEPALPEPIHPAETAVVLKFAFTRTAAASSPTSVSGPGLTPVILSTGDADLLEVWIKECGKSLAGDLELIVALLEKDRVTAAVALAPPAGRGFSSHREFSSHLESLTPKLDSISSPQSFALKVGLSLLSDASGAEAPVEIYTERRLRIYQEFEHLRGSLTLMERADVCLALGLSRMVDQKHVPALDEFASEAAANELKKLLLTGNDTPLAHLFVPAVCSRVHDGDLAGLSLLAATIATSPMERDGGNTNLQYQIFPVQACLVTYANRLDAKLPGAAVEIILTYAKALAARKDPMVQGIAAWYVHLAATDAASLEAGLKRCGLEGVKPTAAFNPNIYGRDISQNLQAMMRVALLHPVSSEALLESLGSLQQMSRSSVNPMLPSLQEPNLRARISPAVFLTWNRHLRSVSPKDLETIHLYAAERRADFDEKQQAELDGLLERLKHAGVPRNADRSEEMRRGQQEAQRLRMEQEMMRREMSR